MLNFVIARYKEDVEWLNQLPADARIYLYNKGPALDQDLFGDRDVRIIDLRNAGRESQTYLHHLMKHFKADEGDFTVFSQADPFEHAPYFLDLVQEHAQWQEVQALSLQWIAGKNVPPAPIVEGDRRDWVGDIPVRPEHFSLHTWAPCGFFDEGAWGIGVTYRQKHMLPSGTHIMSHFLEMCGLQRLSEEAAQADLGVFSYGGIFAVSHRRIAAFLKEAAPHLDKIELLTRADMNYGYMFERVWMHFFGAPFVRFAAQQNHAVAAPRKAQATPVASPAPAADSAPRRVYGGLPNSELRRRAFAAQSNGDVPAAIDLLQAALQADANDHNVVCDLAVLALSQNDLASAEQLARHALRLCSTHGTSAYVLAQSLQRAGKPQESARWLGSLTSGALRDNLQSEAPELLKEARAQLDAIRKGEALPVA